MSATAPNEHDGPGNFSISGLSRLAESQERVLSLLEATASRLAMVEFAPAAPATDEEKERLRQETETLAAALEQERLSAARDKDEARELLRQAEQALEQAALATQEERRLAAELARELEAARSMLEEARADALRAQGDLDALRGEMKRLEDDLSRSAPIPESEEAKAAEKALLEECSRLESSLEEERRRGEQAQALISTLAAERDEARERLALAEERARSAETRVQEFGRQTQQLEARGQELEALRLELEARLAEALAAGERATPVSSNADQEQTSHRTDAADASGVRFWKSCCLGLMLVLVVALSALWGDSDRQKPPSAVQRSAPGEAARSPGADDKERPAPPRQHAIGEAVRPEQPGEPRAKAEQQTSPPAPAAPVASGAPAPAPPTVPAPPGKEILSAAAPETAPTTGPPPAAAPALLPQATAAKPEAAGPDQFSLPFPPAADVLSPAQNKDIAELVKKVLAKPRKVVLVLGYADAQPLRGVLAKRYPDNVALAQARALAVARALVAGGVPEKLVTACGVGAVRPLSSGQPAAGGLLARRADVLAW
ncbi:hypothetical protein NNJEOMEG_00143 [Fundidesulfovibrio magnetotacticus]|uniref:OmpA-like domain-containing protein n=1 Tax=Fundidesulfovibrio magnetotacticus TaxID=2730080 RepID=A0A6V8LQB5_9BACT|nr:OmpA family protein [Fundidesulfovibrio magnetotacticus]GFK92319.1 hypothetical protein NNJEOMEG_00143 [Fundidesulfovibrio magnetotacticus]